MWLFSCYGRVNSAGASCCCSPCTAITPLLRCRCCCCCCCCCCCRAASLVLCIRFSRIRQGVRVAAEMATSGEAFEYGSDDEVVDVEKVVAQFVDPDGEETGPQVLLPLDVTPHQLEVLINEMVNNEDPMPYSFQLEEEELDTNLGDTLEKLKRNKEMVARITYVPLAVFRVRPVTRCSATIPGHKEAILALQFSPDGASLASASGDTTVRIWDMHTQTPRVTCKGHKNWVQCVAWSPNGKYLASGSLDKTVRLWDGMTGEAGKVLTGHTKWISSLAWEPLHLNPNCTRVASASKDGTVRIWNVVRGNTEKTLSGHTMAVTCVKWGGSGLIYSSSEDRTIRVYNAEKGMLVRVLSGHAHWVNVLALSTDYVLRTGAFDHTCTPYDDPEEARAKAQQRYDEATRGKPEKLVRERRPRPLRALYSQASGSDDHTIYLWEPEVAKKPLIRMTGHQQPINSLSYSPDGRLLASASFDQSLKLWNGQTGKFSATLRGHVQKVYMVCWSSDSRMVLSGSQDSTLKIWNLKTNKIKIELPGHADEVYAVDWAPDGQHVASGGKDRVVKLCVLALLEC